jgi:hypothetical protein
MEVVVYSFAGGGRPVCGELGHVWGESHMEVHHLKIQSTTSLGDVAAGDNRASASVFMDDGGSCCVVSLSKASSLFALSLH